MRFRSHNAAPATCCCFWSTSSLFLAESVAGLLAPPLALFADSVDMLRRAIVYGFSLYAIERGVAWKARAALLKGVIMAPFGFARTRQVARSSSPGLGPNPEVMGAVGLVAFAANLFCLVLLRRHRSDDINIAFGLGVFA